MNGPEAELVRSTLTLTRHGQLLVPSAGHVPAAPCTLRFGAMLARLVAGAVRGSQGYEKALSDSP